MDREQLMEMIEKRVSDSSVLRLIRKWIKIGVIDQGQLLVSETGTARPQRAMVALLGHEAGNGGHSQRKPTAPGSPLLGVHIAINCKDLLDN